MKSFVIRNFYGIVRCIRFVPTYIYVGIYMFKSTFKFKLVSTFYLIFPLGLHQFFILSISSFKRTRVAVFVSSLNYTSRTVMKFHMQRANLQAIYFPIKKKLKRYWKYWKRWGDFVLSLSPFKYHNS